MGLLWWRPGGVQDQGAQPQGSQPEPPTAARGSFTDVSAFTAPMLTPADDYHADAFWQALTLAPTSRLAGPAPEPWYGSAGERSFLLDEMFSR